MCSSEPDDDAEQSGLKDVIVSQVKFKDIKQYLDDHLTEICLGIRTRPFDVVKKKLLIFLKDKSPGDLIAAYSELLGHLYLMKEGYQQLTLFLNLEDNSFKKGFDGVFVKDDKICLMESKSGSYTEKPDVFFRGKIRLALIDLKKKVEGLEKNDPWQNAANHIYCSGYDGSVIEKIEKLSDDYVMGNIKHNLEEFDLFPCSTGYCDHMLNLANVEDSVMSLIREYPSDILAMCFSTDEKEILKDYAKESNV